MKIIVFGINFKNGGNFIILKIIIIIDSEEVKFDFFLIKIL